LSFTTDNPDHRTELRAKIADAIDNGVHIRDAADIAETMPAVMVT
jgi:hypothetical protein